METQNELSDMGPWIGGVQHGNIGFLLVWCFELHIGQEVV